MSTTSIEWTDATWNPTVGCDRISPGCAHCYAKTLHDKRHKAALAGKAMAPQYSKPFETLQLIPDRLEDPLHWREPRRVFVDSVSDLFHKDVPDAFIAKVFAVMAVAGASDHDQRPRPFAQRWTGKTWVGGYGPHTFQVLTKRIDRARALLAAARFRHTVAQEAYDYARDRTDAGYLAHQIDTREEYSRCYPPGRMWPLNNVWIGASVENQAMYDKRIGDLLRAPAAVRFLSVEPMLGPIDFRMGGNSMPDYSSHDPLPDINWMIFGFESGAGARAGDLAWIRSGLAQCQSAGVAAFVKQVGAGPIDSAMSQTCCNGKVHYRQPVDSDRDREHKRAISEGRAPAYTVEPMRLVMRNKKGGDPSEWPEDIRVRQFPTSVKKESV